MITVNYLQHRRNFLEPTLTFLEKVKPENLAKLEFRVLSANYPDPAILERLHDIGGEWLMFNGGDNYAYKVDCAIERGGEYSIKMDEDTCINNHVWDYFIENAHMLDDDKHIVFAPLLCNGVPTVEHFMEGFCDKITQMKFNSAFSSYDMRDVGNRWNVDFTNVTQAMIDMPGWHQAEYFHAVEQVDSWMKGVHPIRFMHDQQVNMLEYVLANMDKFCDKQDYGILKNREYPYFCNSFFMIKTDHWKKALQEFNITGFDEAEINEYRRKHDMKFAFIDKGFGVHTLYAYVAIGHPDRLNWEHEYHQRFKTKQEEVLNDTPSNSV